MSIFIPPDGGLHFCSFALVPAKDEHRRDCYQLVVSQNAGFISTCRIDKPEAAESLDTMFVDIYSTAECWPVGAILAITCEGEDVITRDVLYGGTASDVLVRFAGLDEYTAGQGANLNEHYLIPIVLRMSFHLTGIDLFCRED